MDIRSVRDGLWFDSDTWESNHAPGQGDRVTIATGTIVEYSGVTLVIYGEIHVEGTLRFTRVSQSITVLSLSGNLIVEEGGYLDMGTLVSPLIGEADLEFFLPADFAMQGGPEFQTSDIGLWIMGGGRWDVCGQPIGRCWTRLALSAEVGINGIICQGALSNWPVGAEIVIASTDQPKEHYMDSRGRRAARGHWHEEVQKIWGIDPGVGDETLLLLDTPLRYSHLAEGDMNAEVAILSRNVKISSVLPGYVESDDTLYPVQHARRFAHTMFMRGSKGSVRYAEFKYMGHHGVLGRYPIHAHKLGEEGGVAIEGNSILYSGNRGVVVHDSSKVVVEDNVVYDIVGHGFMQETTKGTPALKRPSGDVFTHNLVVRTRDGGSGFWNEGLDNIYLGNVASGVGITKAPTVFHGDSAGFTFPEAANGSGRIRRLVDVYNRGHSNANMTRRTWTNNVPDSHVVGALAYRDGYTAILGGAYEGGFVYHRSMFQQSGGPSIDLTAVKGKFQDCVVIGGGQALSKSGREQGLFINAYLASPKPSEPLMLVRCIFSEHSQGDLVQFSRECNYDKAEKVAWGKNSDCPAVYLLALDCEFQSPAHFNFGSPPNANSFWQIVYPDGLGTMYFRSDQIDVSEQTDITKVLIPTGGFYVSAEEEAIKVPLSNLPALHQFVGLKTIDFSTVSEREGAMNWLWIRNPARPPIVGIKTIQNGNVLTIQVDARQSQNVTRVELYVDEDMVAAYALERSANAYFTQVIDLALHPRKYAYVYAKAYGDSWQVAYSEAQEYYCR